MNKNRRIRSFANKLHRQTFLLVFIAALTPTAIATICLYYLIFGITSMQMIIPEAIAYNIIPAAKTVSTILLVATPAVIIVILFFAYRITHTIVGPFDRIVREIDEVATGKKEGHIIIRKKDKFWPLVEAINKLIDKIKA